MSLIADCRRRLAAAGLAPNRKLGQHFMVDASALQLLAEGAAEAAGRPERVVEIGPGTGLLTERLLAAGQRVLAVEFDRGLAALLRERFPGPACELVEGDALASKNRLHPAIEACAAAAPWALIANLPYDISIPVILNALSLPDPPQLILVTVQREAAERLCAAPGRGSWGATAAVAQAAGAGRIIRRLAPGCFYPPPRVESAILRWQPQRRLPPAFGRFCRDLFAYRRKRVVRALRHCGLPLDRAEALARDCAIAAEQRVEECSVAQLLDLHAHVSEDAR